MTDSLQEVIAGILMILGMVILISLALFTATSLTPPHPMTHLQMSLWRIQVLWEGWLLGAVLMTVGVLTIPD